MEEVSQESIPDPDLCETDADCSENAEETVCATIISSALPVAMKKCIQPSKCGESLSFGDEEVLYDCS